jgi:hypothetical protein
MKRDNRGSLTSLDSNNPNENDNVKSMKINLTISSLTIPVQDTHTV